MYSYSPYDHHDNHPDGRKFWDYKGIRMRHISPTAIRICMFHPKCIVEKYCGLENIHIDYSTIHGFYNTKRHEPKDFTKHIHIGIGL